MRASANSEGPALQAIDFKQRTRERDNQLDYFQQREWEVSIEGAHED